MNLILGLIWSDPFHIGHDNMKMIDEWRGNYFVLTEDVI